MNSAAGDGWAFCIRFCFNCQKDTVSPVCPILRRALSLSVDDPAYPKEWIEDEQGPRCTAFQEKENPAA